MNKKILIGLIIVVVALIAWWMFGSESTAPTTGETPAQSSAESTYAQDLNGLNDVDITNEMQGVDANINQL